MIAFIEGKVIQILDKSIIVLVDCGIGYEVFVSKRLDVSMGQKLSLCTHLIHKEDSMSLYGFATKEEKSMFLTLISAQGVGAKLAMEILSYYSVSDNRYFIYTKYIKIKKSARHGGKKMREIAF